MFGKSHVNLLEYDYRIPSTSTSFLNSPVAMARCMAARQ